MRLRLVSVIYDFGGPAPSLERHYRELREAMLHPGQQYAYMQSAAPWRPPTDIHETPDAIIVKMELAGMREDGIDVALYENALVISGHRDDDADHDETICYHEAQVHYGPFRADIVLPEPIQQEATQATYENGFLRIRLPKAVRTQPSAEREHSRTNASAAHHRSTQMRAAALPVPSGSCAYAAPCAEGAAQGQGGR